MQITSKLRGYSCMYENVSSPAFTKLVYVGKKSNTKLTLIVIVIGSVMV